MLATFTYFTLTIRINRQPLLLTKLTIWLIAVEIFQTQNVSSFSSQFYIKAVAAKWRKKKIRSYWHMAGNERMSIASSFFLLLITIMLPAIVKYFLP